MYVLNIEETQAIDGGNCDCVCKQCPTCGTDIHVGAQPRADDCKGRCQELWMTFVSCINHAIQVTPKPPLPK